MALFVRAPNPIWFLVDLQGLPLNDEYWAIFLTNTLPYIPQPPTHDPEGLIPWSGGKVQFQPGGTLPNELYFNPDLVYRIEIRHGPSQTDPLIYEVNDFVPESSNSNTQNDLIGEENQITNPQFQNISFVSPFTYQQLVDGDTTLEIAPGWFLVLSGTGTTVLTQLFLAGTAHIQGNPPSALRINNAGWTTAILRQRFNKNGAIFSSGAISMNATVRGQGSAQDLTFNYVPSSPGVAKTILSATAPNGTWAVLRGAIDLPDSSNSNTDDNAYVDMEITLQPTGIIDITNVQVLGQSVHLSVSPLLTSDVPLFIEQTNERQLDQEFHYYSSSILILPKKSLTSGWNFRNNPWQFNSGSGQTISTTPLYTADQTIVVSSAVNSITAKRCTNPIGLFQIVAINSVTQGQIAIFQYVDPDAFRPYWSYRFSILVRARIVTNNNTQIKLKARAFTSNGYPNSLSSTDPIASWGINGDPVFNGFYTGIEPNNDPEYILQNSYDTKSGLLSPVCPPMAYNNFSISPIVSSNNPVTCGVMIYTVGKLNNSDVDSILIEEITFVPNPFAMDNVSLTFSEEVHQCQAFYEKSYNLVDQPEEKTFEGSAVCQVASDVGAAVGLNTSFKVTKIKKPSIKWYSPQNGTGDRIYDQKAGLDKAVSSTSGTGTSLTGFPNVSPTILDQSTVFGQWTADAKLGI